MRAFEPPKLTGLYLENFRSIRGPVSLDLAPITLLYGPNSAGKSVIHEAIQLAGQLSAGSWLRAGRARQVIDSMHHHEYDKQMVIAVRYTHADLENRVNRETVDMPPSVYEENFPDLFKYLRSDEIHRSTIEVKFEIAFNCTTGNGSAEQSPTPYVSCETISIDGWPLVLLLADARTILFVLDHPLMARIEADLKKRKTSFIRLVEAIFKKEAIEVDESRILSVDVANLADDLQRRSLHSDLPEEEADGRNTKAGKLVSSDKHLLDAVIGSLFLAPMKDVQYLLNDLCHVGPIRKIPSERQLMFLLTTSAYPHPHYQSEYYQSEYWSEYWNEYYQSEYHAYASLEPLGNQWTDGTAAWKALAEKAAVHFLTATGTYEKVGLVDAVNAWLGAEQRLGMPHIIIVHYGSVRLDAESETPDARPPDSKRQDQAPLFPDLIARIRLKDTNTDLAVDVDGVGAGVPQIVPIIVAGFVKRSVSIEQPELHLHPKLQTEIADYFISRLNTEKVNFLVETHSEYVALRLLRRVRETRHAHIKHRDFSITEDDVAFYYFDPVGGVTRVTRLRVSAEGEFLDRWPKGFFAEREAELFDEND